MTRFKQACVTDRSNVLEFSQNQTAQSYSQFIADSVDHNVATSDGHGTFHGMGIIAATSKNANVNILKAKLRRPTKLLKVEDYMSKSPAIPIREYIPFDYDNFAKLKFKPGIEF